MVKKRWFYLSIVLMIVLAGMLLSSPKDMPHLKLITHEMNCMRWEDQQQRAMPGVSIGVNLVENKVIGPSLTLLQPPPIRVCARWEWTEREMAAGW